MPNCDFVAEEDFSDDGGIGGDKDISFVVNFQVVQIHDVACPAEGLAIFARSLDMLILGKESHGSQ